MADHVERLSDATVELESAARDPHEDQTGIGFETMSGEREERENTA